MKIRNVSPLGAIEIPELRVEVEAGGVFEAPEPVAKKLLRQTINFAPVVDEKKEAKK